MDHLSPIELANWLSLYLATAMCCAIAAALSVGFLASQLYREQPWRQVTGVRAAVLFVPQTWWRWQKLYLCSTPVTLGIVALFGASLSWH